MDRFFWSTSGTLESLHKEEPLVTNLRKQLLEAVETSCNYAREYLALFEPYESILALDTKAHLREVRSFAIVSRICKDIHEIYWKLSADEFDQIEASQPPLSELLATIDKENDKLNELVDRFPSSIAVGAYLITASAAKDTLIKRQKQVCEGLVNIVSTIPKSISAKAIKKFEEIDRHLKVFFFFFF